MDIFDSKELWDNYGVVDDILVRLVMLPIKRCDILLIFPPASRLLLTFHVQTSTA